MAAVLAAIPFESAAQTTYEARLSGHHKVPPIPSTAAGSITATLDEDTLTVSGSFEGLSSKYTNAHIHVGRAGTSGGVSQGLTPSLPEDSLSGSFDAADNTFVLSDEQKADLQNRELYVNIHTSGYPAGEIRGQLLQEADAHYYGVLSGGTQVGGVNTVGQGAIAAELHGDTLKLTGAFSGLTSAYNQDVAAGSGAHLHTAYAGSNGGVAQALTPTVDADTAGTFPLADNTLTLTSEQKTALQDRRIYVNVHSENHPSGELRAQLVPVSDAYFETVLTGTAKVPRVETNGSGQAIVELRGDSIWVSGSFDGLTSDYTNSHLHAGMAGRTGGVEVGLTVSTGTETTSGTWTATDNSAALSADQKESLYGRGLYLNVHTSRNPPGEIRGQALPISQLYLQSSLSGMNEVDPDTSSAIGAVVAEISGDRMVLTGGFSGLVGDLRGSAGDAHLHLGSAAENGGVDFHLEPSSTDMRSGTFEASSNTVTTGPDTLETIRSGGYYVNVHSQAYPAGEIRGQLLLSPNHAPGSSGIDSPADGASVDVSGESSQTLSVEWDGVTDPDGDEVVYVLQMATDTSFSSESLVINDNVGTDSMTTLTYGRLDSLLEDRGVSEGSSATWHHRIVASDGSDRARGASFDLVLNRGTVTATEVTTELPRRFELRGNYPNPFNPTTTVQFALPQPAEVTVQVYNTLGQNVLTVDGGRMAAGANREIRLDASALPSGLYLYRVQARMQAATRTQIDKMMLLK
mgnify:CR=1 FL=1